MIGRASTIRRYILDLLKRIVRVSLETMKIVNALPALNEKK
jgi:predicted helicase